MKTQILSGKKIGMRIENGLLEETQRLFKLGIQPCLAVILVGNDPASRVYVGRKVAVCKTLGIRSIEKILPETTAPNELDAVIDELNRDPGVNGILCQVPLPPQLNETAVINRINPEKDVDCFHPYNVGCLATGNPTFMPCTPYGILQILSRSGIDTRGKKIAVVGRSNIVGRPLSVLLSLKGWDATVTLCHSATNDLATVCFQSDIVISAIGKPNFIVGDMIQPGAVVIDVGINRVSAKNPKGFKLVGDVDWESIQGIASAATPVPGGVGPLTIMMLMYNTINAALVQNQQLPFTL